MLRIDGTQIRTIPVVFNTKGRLKMLDSDSDDLYHFPSLSPARCLPYYSGLTLNQYGVASPCRTICTAFGFVALS